MSYAIAKAEASSSGIGICGLMFIIMFGLKLADIIDISWWWVTAPLWIPVVIFLTVVVGFIGFYVYKEVKK